METYLTHSDIPGHRVEADPDIIANLVRKGWVAQQRPPYNAETHRAVWDNGAWLVEEIPEEPVPSQVTRAQLKMWLLANGKLAAVEAIFAEQPVFMTEEQWQAAKIQWEDAQNFERANPLIDQLGAVLSMNSAAIDQAFREAALLLTGAS